MFNVCSRYQQMLARCLRYCKQLLSCYPGLSLYYSNYSERIVWTMVCLSAIIHARMMVGTIESR
jgi:hypothetical protein